MRSTNIVEDSLSIRHKCIEAIDDSDVVVVYLDNYGMDSAWEIGYVERAGKRIVGLSLDAQELNTPKGTRPQTIWDHWMHGWKEHTIVHGFDIFAMMSEDSIKVQIPVVCPIMENHEDSGVRILVQERTKPSDRIYYGTIELPGGKARRGETISEAIKKGSERRMRSRCQFTI